MSTMTRGLSVAALAAAAFVVPAGAGEVPAELPKPDKTPPDTTKPLKVYMLSGQSNMVGMGRIAGDGPETLETLVKREGKFQHLIGDDGKWTTRNDAYFVSLTNRRIARWLTVGVMGGNVGPEVQFGHIMGWYHDEMVLVIKIAQGNRSISFDVTPPSSRIGAPKKGKFYTGWQYDAFVRDAHKILDNLKEYFPAYKDQGYEVAGFCWWQGHKDAGLSARYYERHLVNLINDFREEFDAPKAKFVVATVGFGGRSMSRAYREIHKAQMAVSDYEKYPEFKGNVASVDAKPFWRGGGYHYGNNAETFTLVGDALGREMVKLLETDKAEKAKKVDEADDSAAAPKAE